MECGPTPPQKLEDLLLGTFKENPHFFLSFLLYSFYSLSHTKHRKERKEKERQENQWEDRKFVLQIIFLFIPGSFKHPATLLHLPLELNQGLLLHSHRNVSKNTFFFFLPKSGLQLEGIEIGYAKAFVQDQITQIKLIYNRILAYRAIMG